MACRRDDRPTRSQADDRCTSKRLQAARVSKGRRGSPAALRRLANKAFGMGGMHGRDGLPLIPRWLSAALKMSPPARSPGNRPQGSIAPSRLARPLHCRSMQDDSASVNRASCDRASGRPCAALPKPPSSAAVLRSGNGSTAPASCPCPRTGACRHGAGPCDQRPWPGAGGVARGTRHIRRVDAGAERFRVHGASVSRNLVRLTRRGFRPCGVARVSNAPGTAHVSPRPVRYSQDDGMDDADGRAFATPKKENPRRRAGLT
jgi:hypothetical protein